jgi:hypothetical protein
MMADEFGVNRETIRQILVEDLGVPGRSNKTSSDKLVVNNSLAVVETHKHCLHF